MIQSLIAFALAAALVVGIFWWRRGGSARPRGAAGESGAAAEGAAPAPAFAAQAPDLATRVYAIAFSATPDAGVAFDPDDSRHLDVRRSASATLAGADAGARHIPRRPHLLPQLLNAVNDNDASGRDIAAIIAQDAALAGNLLRIANSPFYRVQSRHLDSIERAVTLIGTDGVRRLISVVLMQPVARSGNDTFGRLQSLIWDHGQLVAAACLEHARRVEQADPFQAQMLGLLHGLGASVVVHVARDAYARHPRLAPSADVTLDLLGEWTLAAARRIAESWDLAPQLARALDDQNPQVHAHKASPLGRSLRIGRIAGAASMLVRAEAMDGTEALAQLAQGGVHGSAAQAIWERVDRSPSEE